MPSESFTANLPNPARHTMRAGSARLKQRIICPELMPIHRQ
jgi:hypothetical protein